MQQRDFEKCDSQRYNHCALSYSAAMENSNDRGRSYSPGEDPSQVSLQGLAARKNLKCSRITAYSKCDAIMI